MAFDSDDRGQEVARQLISDVGCEPLDASDLRRARHLEAMGTSGLPW